MEFDGGLPRAEAERQAAQARGFKTAAELRAALARAARAERERASPKL
jgi:hypothetical protein